MSRPTRQLFCSSWPHRWGRFREPSQPAHQQTVSAHRTQLEEALAEAASNDFSPAWREALQELDVADLLGERLLARIRSVFERHQITPSAAADELTPLAESLQTLDTTLRSTLEAFDFFGIGAETLPAGEFEIGFLVPRPQVREELSALGAEFLELKRILGPFLELGTGSRPDVRVRSIASSDFQVLLESAPAVALILATALERLISSYEKVMNIRLAYTQLKESGASEETLASVSAEADAKMAADIEAVADELVQRAEQVDAARRNELKTEMRKSLNALANRIDRGYSVEVRAGELPPPDAEDDDEDGEEVDPGERQLREQTEKVLAAQRRLSFRNVSGEPILALPEGDDEEADPGG